MESRCVVCDLGSGIEIGDELEAVERTEVSLKGRILEKGKEVRSTIFI